MTVNYRNLCDELLVGIDKLFLAPQYPCLGFTSRKISMFYLIGQIGLILAVAAVLFFALGYWYGRHKSTEKQQPLVFEKGSVTAAAVAVLEDKIQQKDRQISLIQEQMADLEAGFTRGRTRDEITKPNHCQSGEDAQVGTQVSAEIGSGEQLPLETVDSDDLTKMRGIGKALNQQLNELGITSFAQIAKWSKEDVKEYALKLALKDRIRRDNWVAQAKKFSS